MYVNILCNQMLTLGMLYKISLSSIKHIYIYIYICLYITTLTNTIFKESSIQECQREREQERERERARERMRYDHPWKRITLLSNIEVYSIQNSITFSILNTAVIARNHQLMPWYTPLSPR